MNIQAELEQELTDLINISNTRAALNEEPSKTVEARITEIERELDRLVYGS